MVNRVSEPPPLRSAAVNSIDRCATSRDRRPKQRAIARRARARGATRPRPSSAGRLARIGKTFGRGRPRSPDAAHAATASGAAEPGCCALLSRRRRRTPSPRHRTRPRKPPPCRSTRCRYSPAPAGQAQRLRSPRSPARSERQRRQPTRCRYSPRPASPPQAPSNRHRRPERHLPAGPAPGSPDTKKAPRGSQQPEKARSRELRPDPHQKETLDGPLSPP